MKGRDEENYTALHWAVKRNFVQCTEFLITKGGLGAEVSGTRAAASSPLHLAASLGLPEIIKVLIANGALMVSERDALPLKKGNKQKKNNLQMGKHTYIIV